MLGLLGNIDRAFRSGEFGPVLLFDRLIDVLRQRRNGRNAVSARALGTAEQTGIRGRAHQREGARRRAGASPVLVRRVVATVTCSNGRGPREPVLRSYGSFPRSIIVLDRPVVPGCIGERVWLAGCLQRGTRREGRQGPSVNHIGRPRWAVEWDLGHVYVKHISNY